MNNGRKESDGKPAMDLIPPIVLQALAEILTFGGQKYEPYNWTKGLPWSKVYAALQRHLNSWWSGERYDKETNKSHLWHAVCDLAFLITYEHYNMGTNDKPKWPQPTYQPSRLYELGLEFFREGKLDTAPLEDVQKTVTSDSTVNDDDEVHNPETCPVCIELDDFAKKNKGGV